MNVRVLVGLVWVVGFGISPATADQAEYDVVVYGDASGGVTAAVQAARMGKRVALVSQYGHLGGLTSSGLGWTDIGNDAILGGLSREFYHELYLHYQKPEAWTHEDRAKFANKGQGVPALNAKTELASTFEPKAAEAVFDAMIAEAGVKVIKGRLDLERGVSKAGKRIRSIRLEDGTVIKGRMFIDASYEGDLLPLAGVSFVVGRESNSEFDEQGNGNTGIARKNQLRNGIDAYVVKGDPSSGLLPGVNAGLGGEKGDGDHRLQAYCYRMVLTDAAANRVRIARPEGYDAADYEILFRAIEAGQHGGFFKTSPMPNRKTDSNNTGGISTDYIGMNYGDDWNWATLDHDERAALAARHRDWQLGLVWTLQNHPRVPQRIRDAYARWGLPKDEFADNGHWPYNLYVREARRMRSDFVMTEKHCKRTLPVDDPVGMGAYTLDSHNTQRVAHNGMVKNEGDIQSYLGGKAYGISYRAIVPPADECENLLVPWALSATHIAFGSIRMEPVFMILGQSAATAAVQALDAGVSVQDVDYDKLAARLKADGQVLEHIKPTAAGGLDAGKLQGIVVDDDAAEMAGHWVASTSVGPFVGGGYVHDGNAGKGQRTAVFKAKLTPGHYEVRLAYSPNENRASNVPVTIAHADGRATRRIDQRIRPKIDGAFVSLGRYTFGPAGVVELSNAGTDGYVIADAVVFVPVKTE